MKEDLIVADFGNHSVRNGAAGRAATTVAGSLEGGRAGKGHADGTAQLRASTRP